MLYNHTFIICKIHINYNHKIILIISFRNYYMSGIFHTAVITYPRFYTPDI